jgi:hypothetical protein
MTKPGFVHSSRIQNNYAVAAALLLTCQYLFGGTAFAESVPEIQQLPVETVAVPLHATELRIYKQRFDVAAEVRCNIPKKGPSFCTTNIGSAISSQIEPEMILKYNSIILDEQEFAPQISSYGGLKFRTDKIDYSGLQTFEVELIYLK